MPSSLAHTPTTASPGRLAEIVIVDAACGRYADFVNAARAGTVGLHVCLDGRSAIRLSRRFRADAWLVAIDLPDMSGHDVVEMLERPGIFVVADDYRQEDEQRALAAGVAGYLVGPVTLDTILPGCAARATRRGVGSTARDRD